MTVEVEPIDIQPVAQQLSARDRAILRAVVNGTAEFVWGAEPDLYIDGRFCCDQAAAHRLVKAGLIGPVVEVPITQRVPAQLTPAGVQAI
ncbi:hypothetical protein [Pseudonocardia sp. TRM90224]|uniref:hypothetical protein n=1 Tax=Pseudonocardia sp. TRM90224 TaxID=2812678 RepID=UPI001E5C3BCC|nr:hypothetical protein [Pseudonocardia sp. TRM90224]